jgi:N-acetylneuraminate synthase
MKVNFIAEVSSNHSKNLDRSLEFIDRAADIGCDAVKFQLFRISHLFAPEILNKRKEIAQRKKWELPLEFLEPLSQQCKKRSIKFSCTPFYLEAVEELLPYIDFYKIASYELLWDSLLEACAKTGKPIIISTGMANTEEIEHAVSVLKKNGCSELILLHCTSSYPTPYKDANLSAIKSIRDLTGCDVGWSDHTVDAGVIHRSIHRWGARTIEFHFDLDGNGEEFDGGHCWLPNQIGDVIKQVNHGIISDGDGIKKPVDSEMNERMWRADPSDGLRPIKSIRDQFKT